MSRTPPQAVLKGAASSTAMASPRAAHIFCCMAVSSLCAVSAAPHGAASNLLKIALRHQAVNKTVAPTGQIATARPQAAAPPSGVAAARPCTSSPPGCATLFPMQWHPGETAHRHLRRHANAFRKGSNL